LALRLSILGPGVQREEQVHSVFAVENPLMDVISHVDYSFLERFKKQPGTMHLVEYAEVASLLREAGASKTFPGGSAANTARGVAWLSGASARGLVESILGSAAAAATALPPVFNGAIGRDPRGDEFAARIEAEGVHGSLVRKDTPTGTSVILVTPDGERTMNTFLGACRGFTAADLDLERLAESRMLYLTGYLWDTDNQREAAEAACASARRNAIPIAFDLADPFAVRRYGEKFRSWIPGKVDVLFGNKDELSLLTGAACDEDCASEAAALAPLAVMKVGDKGCILSWHGRLEQVPAVRVTRVDTTGAGDSFAAGFLYGRLAGADPITCARLANAVAARVVGVEGCRYDT
jgi:sugar/nucleoside kinase (ribokinase family)